MADKRTRGFPVEPVFKVKPNLDPTRYSQTIVDPVVQNQTVSDEYSDFRSVQSFTPSIPSATSPHFEVTYQFNRLTNYFSFWFGNYFKSTNTELFVPNQIRIVVTGVNKSATIYHNPSVTPLAGSLTGIQYTSFNDIAVFSYSGDEVRSIDWQFFYNYKLPQVAPVYPGGAPSSDWAPYVMLNHGYARGLKGFYLSK